MPTEPTKVPDPQPPAMLNWSLACSSRGPVDVDQLVGHRFDVGHDLLLIEMTHAGQLADGLHQQRAVVQLARQRVEFAADHLVVDAHVARDAHVVDRELLAFEDLHLHVDRVGADDDLGRFDLRHQIAVVLIERLDRHVLGIVLLAVAQPLVDRLLVVGVARA